MTNSRIGKCWFIRRNKKLKLMSIHNDTHELVALRVKAEVHDTPIGKEVKYYDMVIDGYRKQEDGIAQFYNMTDESYTVKLPRNH